MDTVTYPDAAVSELLDQEFALVKINLSDPAPATRDLLRQAKPLWAPLFIAFDRKGTELRRWIGFLPPAEFIAELRFVLGMQKLLRREMEQSIREFRAACDVTPDASVAPEALFWAGAAAYQSGGGMAALRSVWSELQSRYPASTWARRSDVFDMLE
jgi:hypothetical protein